MFDLIYKIDDHKYYINISPNFIYVETYKHYITIKR